MQVEACNGSSVVWPPAVCACFGTLRNLPRGVQEAARVSTASNQDTLVWIGALVEWHLANDQAFEAAAHATAQDESTHLRWPTNRPLVARRFDDQFVEAALSARAGLLGEMVCTVDFLDAPRVLQLLAECVQQRCTRAIDYAALRRAVCGDIKCTC